MTLKQAKLLKHMADADVSTVIEAGRRAGYKVDNGSRQIYRLSTRKHIIEAIASDPKAIKRKYEELYAQCVAKDDQANATRILDSLARINGMNLDRSKQEIEISEADSIVLKRAKERII